VIAGLGNYAIVHSSLAEAEVQRAKVDAGTQIREADKRRQESAEEVMRILGNHELKLGASEWQQIMTLLGVTFGVGNRVARRTGGSKLVASATQFERDLDRAQRKAGTQRAFEPAAFTPKDLRVAADELERRGKRADDRELLELLGCGDGTEVT
jgi:hypothetical protein